MKVILLIGPGGVGKSTAGKIVAEKLDYKLIDLDDEFCQRIQNVGKFILNCGYEEYCKQNSQLFKKIKTEIKNDTVIVLSSGFLANDNQGEIIRDNFKEIKNFGLKILLLPSKNISKAKEIVVKRQLKRGFGLKREREEIKFEKRYYKYLEYDYDLVVFSDKSPKQMAELIICKIGSK